MRIISDKRVKTRKPHVCWGCNTLEPIGTIMLAIAQADGGTVNTTYWCMTCMTYMARYFDDGDVYGSGDIIANDPERWAEIHEQVKRRIYLQKSAEIVVKNAQ